eukprot:Platyproteum_vivax@DN16599_c0_g1_i1.p2
MGQPAPKQPQQDLNPHYVERSSTGGGNPSNGRIAGGLSVGMPTTNQSLGVGPGGVMGVHSGGGGGVASGMPVVSQNVIPPQNNNHKVCWEGTLLRSKKNLVQVKLIHLSGPVVELLPPATEKLNVSHRTQYEEVAKKHILAVCYLECLAAYASTFDEYIEYFNEKARAGVVQLDNNITLNLLPPNLTLFDEFQLTNLPSNTLLGLFTPSNPQTQPSAPPPAAGAGMYGGQHLGGMQQQLAPQQQQQQQQLNMANW